MLKYTNANFRKSLAFATLAFGFMASEAFAQSARWNVNANGNWGTAANWLEGTPPGVTTGVATFGDTFSPNNLRMSGARTVTNDINPTMLSGITFDADFSYTISGGTSIGLAAGPFTLDANRNTFISFTEFSNFTNHFISSVLSGTTSSFDKIGSGTVTLSGANTFTATNGINITAGSLIASDAALGNSTNSINLNGGAIQLGVTSRTVNIGSNGGGIGAGSLDGQLNGQLNGTGRLTFLIETGRTMTIGGNSTGFLGEVVIDSGTLDLSGINSALSGTAMLDVFGELTLTNSTNNNTDRIADTRDVTMRGARFSLVGNSAGTLENVGNLNLATGASIITVTSGTNSSTLRFGGLTRNNNSTVFFRGTTLGGAAAGNSQIEFASSPGTLIGGGGARSAGVTNISILPFASGSQSATGTTRDLVSWDNVTGRIFVLEASNYAALGTATANDNVAVTTATSVRAGGQTINALKLSTDLNGAPGDVLTVTSGAILVNGFSSINANVNFGAAEGVLHARSNTTINGVLSGSGGLTISGPSTVRLNGLNTYSGATVLNEGGIVLSGIFNNGRVDAGAPSALGNHSSAIVMNGFSATGSTSFYVEDGLYTIGRDFVINTGGKGRIDLGNINFGELVINGNIQINNLGNSPSSGDLRLQGDSQGAIVANGIISGNGSITELSNPGDFRRLQVVLNGNNTYSGGTNTLGGRITLGHNNAFGTGPVSLKSGTTMIRTISGSRTLANKFHFERGDLEIGDSSTAGSNQFTLNGEIHLNGRDNAKIDVSASGAGATINGVISGGSLVKAGAGKLTVTAANTYTGTTKVDRGTFFVNNTTGSGTGAGAVTAAAGTTLGGSGSMNGPVTVSGTLAPGASIESLATGALTMNSGSTFQFESLNNSATGADLLKVNGGLILTNVTLDLTLANLNAGTWAPNDKLTLIAYGGSAITSGFANFADDVIFMQGTNEWLFNYNDTTPGSNYIGEATGSAHFITIKAVPEPSTGLLMLGITTILAVFRRSRRND